MIHGIGIDIVAIHRIQHILEQNPRFVDKIFSVQEIDYCSKRANPAQSYAARFAAKEAFLKAIGTGWDQGISWCEIEVWNLDKGKPEMKISGRTKEIADSQGVASIHLSLSHEKENAIAMVVLERT